MASDESRCKLHNATRRSWSWGAPGRSWWPELETRLKSAAKGVEAQKRAGAVQERERGATRRVLPPRRRARHAPQRTMAAQVEEEISAGAEKNTTRWSSDEKSAEATRSKAGGKGRS